MTPLRLVPPTAATTMSPEQPTARFLACPVPVAIV